MAQQRVNAETKQAVAARSVASLDARMLEADLKEAMQMQNLDAALSRETFNRLQLFIDKVSMTPALDLQCNRALADMFSQSIGRIQELIAEVQAAQTEEDAGKHLTLLKKQIEAAIAKSEILKK
ncbi:MAG: hypothetical protein K2J31_00945 [Alistipes sp.]|nr:hypothetical protein [Alistipes sp.]